MSYYRHRLSARNYRRGVHGAEPKNVFSYDTDRVFAAAASAFRINGDEYLREPVTDYDDTGKVIRTRLANRVVMKKILTNSMSTGEYHNMERDEDLGNETRTYFQGKMLDVIAGTAKPYIQAAVTVASKDHIENLLEIGLIASLIPAYINGVNFDEKKERFDTYESRHFGNVGDKITNVVSIVDHRYIKSVGRYIYVARNTAGNLIQWWHDKAIMSTNVTVTGRIKGHGQEYSSKVPVTQFNYVKIEE